MWSWRAWNNEFGTWSAFRSAAGFESALGKSVAKAQGFFASTDESTKAVFASANKCGNFWKAKNSSRFAGALIVSDLHDKHCDPFMLGVAVDVAKRRQPTYVVINGDLFDMYEFSRFAHDPRNYDIPGRFAAAKSIMGKFRKACPDAQIDLVIGNHEFRLLKILHDKSPQILSLLHDAAGIPLERLFCLEEFKVNLVSKLDLSAWRASRLKQNFAVYDECFVAAHEQDFGFGLDGTSGHTHRPMISFNKDLRGARSWMTTGCMCGTDEEYIEGLPKAIQAFGFATIDRKRKAVQQELFALQGDSLVIDGKLYSRG